MVPRLAAAFGLTVALVAYPVVAAETGSSDTAAEQSQDKRDKKSDAKTGDKSGDKADEKSEKLESAKEAKEEESKPPDPCDPRTQLINFDLRNRLCKSGVKLSITETSELLDNLTGGVRQGPIYEGLSDINLAIDLRPTLHLRGNIFARAYQIHGRGLTANNLDNLNFASGIEAERTTRLSEFWYEQHFDYWRLRIGQQSIGTDFFNPESARLFVNGTFGWPTQPSLDLPSGGPGFPLGTPAVRLRVDPAASWTYFLALFNGDPTGAGVGGSQLRDASGTAFRTSDGAWVLSELRYNPDNSEKHGTYRFGAWWNSERFRDLHVDQNGISLASPASNGKPFRHDGDYSAYINIDQPFLFDEKEHTSVSVFARAGITPSDRNLNDIYVDAGILYKGPFGRADDQTGIAVAYAHIGDAARAFDADIQRFTGQFHPTRSGEVVLELTYRVQLTEWCQLQPDFQYVFNPGGGIVNPNAPNQRVGDAAVLGLRTAITF